MALDGIHGGNARIVGNQVSFTFPDGTVKMTLRQVLKTAVETRSPIYPEGMQVAFIERDLVHVYFGNIPIVFDESKLYDYIR